jgi:iron complex outermembrane receptor protein
MKLAPKSAMHAKIVLAGSVAVLSAIFPSSPLGAQSMDYGALEQLFGEPVTTSVDGSPQRVSDAPATMEIITAEEIRRSGAKDIPGVLRHVAGVDTLEWANDDIDVSVRGYDQPFSSRLLVLVDGRQVYLDDFDYTPWSSVPVELAAIRQIEVVKGPHSALFGFNAVGGVINIITYNPLYDTVDTVSSTGGTQALREISIVATHKFGARAAVRLSAGGYLGSDFSTQIPIAEDVVARPAPYRDAINLASFIRINAKMQLSFEGTQSATEQAELGPTYLLSNSQYNSESLKTSLTAETGAGLLQATVYTNWVKQPTRSGTGSPNTQFDNRVTVAQFGDTFRAGANHVFRAALEYRYNTEASAPTPGASVHYNNYAASGMWSWKITPAVSFTNAVRIDHLLLSREGYIPPGFPFVDSNWDRAFTVPSFNSGLVWKPSETNSLRFLASQGNELPNLNISGAYLEINPYLNISGTPFLNPTIVTNYEIGWDHVVIDPHLQLRVSAFRENNHDLLSIAGGYIPTPDGPYSLPDNVGSSNALGLELGFKGTFAEHYRWSVDYRPEKIADHLIPAAQNGVAYLDYQHTTPVHLVKGNLGWATRSWEIDGFFHYQSFSQGLRPTATGTALAPIAGFAATDGRIAYNPRKWTTWSVSGQNLTRRSQLQTTGPAVERRVLGTLSFSF